MQFHRKKMGALNKAGLMFGLTNFFSGYRIIIIIGSDIGLSIFSPTRNRFGNRYLGIEVGLGNFFRTSSNNNFIKLLRTSITGTL
jgi:hypothetical protein